MSRVVATALDASKVSLVLRLKSPAAGTFSYLQGPRQCLLRLGSVQALSRSPSFTIFLTIADVNSMYFE